MARLIDADMLIDSLNIRSVTYNCIINKCIDDAPTVDAVEVVRCKDCKHWHREIHNGVEYFNFSSCDLNHYGDGNNFYCADGERRTMND